jgi:hypothetical protein
MSITHFPVTVPVAGTLKSKIVCPHAPTKSRRPLFLGINKEKSSSDTSLTFGYFDQEEPKSGHAHAAACQPRRPETHRHQRHRRRFSSSFSAALRARSNDKTSTRRNNCYSRKKQQRAPTGRFRDFQKRKMLRRQVTKRRTCGQRGGGR